MTKKEKTFRIYGKYRGRTEVIDEFETEKEARKMLTEYCMAYGAGWALWIVDPQSVRLTG